GFDCVVTEGCTPTNPSITSTRVGLTVNPFPAAAGSILGFATVCQGQTSVSYSVGPIADATSYVWSYSGTGAAINVTGNSVTIDFSAAATSGNLKVKGHNSCGDGTPSSIAITMDTTAPASQVNVPANNGSQTALASISGSASDTGGTGVQIVQISLMR